MNRRIPEIILDIDGTSGGKAELNVGSWVRMLERVSGVQSIYIRKPNTFAFELPLASMNLPPDQAAVVGDRLWTDIVGAQRLGMSTYWSEAANSGSWILRAAFSRTLSLIA